MNKRKIADKFFLMVAVALIGFGTFNLSTSIYAQDSSQLVSECITYPNGTQVGHCDLWDMVGPLALEQFLSTIGPLVSGAIIMMTQFLRKKGIQISTEAEQYLAITARSLVEDQSRFIFKNFITADKKTRDLILAGKIPPDLVTKTFDHVKNALTNEIRSDKFTKTTREILSDNLDAIIEKSVSDHRKDQAKKIKTIFLDTVPIAIDAGLLYHSKSSITLEEKAALIKRAIDAIAKNFDIEYIIMPEISAKIYVEAELNKKLTERKIKSDETSILDAPPVNAGSHSGEIDKDRIN